MIHYHGTPITPRSILYELHGRHFCVSYADSRDVKIVHQIGQSVMLDNGAFTAWKRNRKIEIYPWDGYYSWVRPWLDYQTTWCVIPDVINGTEQQNAALLAEWFCHFKSFKQAAPVWHLHESFDYLERLTSSFERVCFGSSGQYAQIGSTAWNNRVNEAFNILCRGSGRPPCWIHMLRGMSLSGSVYPFASVDSTDVARNHEQKPGRALEMATKWDAVQCPPTWTRQPVQTLLEASS